MYASVRPLAYVPIGLHSFKGAARVGRGFVRGGARRRYSDVALCVRRVARVSQEHDDVWVVVSQRISTIVVSIWDDRGFVQVYVVLWLSCSFSTLVRVFAVY